MAPGLRTFIVVLLLGNGVALLWMSGHYDPIGGNASEPKTKTASLTVWDAEDPKGKFWGNESGKVVKLEGPGISGRGQALTIRFEGAGWRGCGLNWQGWFPADSCDDVSAFRSLVFHVRQVTQVADADLTIHLVDNVKRADQGTVSNGLSVRENGSVSRIDGEWRRVVIPLERFSCDRDLKLKHLWGIDFSNGSGRDLTFQIDRISFTNDEPLAAKFMTTDSYAVTASVDVNGPTHPIRDEIFGACEMPREKMLAYGVPIARWGGNRTSRFNWKLNADNAGKDWFFKNGGQKAADADDNGWTMFIRNQREANATGYVTIPMLGFVAKDQESYSYSVGKYGAQQSTEAGHADVGNGVLSSGRPIVDNHWRDTSVAIGPDFIAQGIQLAVRRAGSSATRYWVLDNEPMLWHETHRDVRPKPLGYNELWERTEKYAEAIKQADPSAKVAGFCSWGWKDLYFSAADEHEGQLNRSDSHAHGNAGLAEWFIKKCGDYKREHGTALVDVFDFHWYPQAEVAGRSPYLGTGNDRKLNQLRLRTTRDLWDPTYQQESWIRDANGSQPTMALRRVRGWIEKHNPGMELCVGEYNFGGGDNISGALAQADVFGILARERADLAFIWTAPEGSQELAWKLFRNYDGAGGRFGDRCLTCTAGHDDLTVYAAKRTKDGATTIAVVNKSLSGQCTLTLNVSSLKGRMRVWRFDQETSSEVVEIGGEARSVDGQIKLTIPAASATMLVVK